VTLTREQLLARYPNASESFLRANAGANTTVFPAPLRVMPSHGIGSTDHQPNARETRKDGAPRIRQRQSPFGSKLEAAFFEYLGAAWPGELILPQWPKLPLANGSTFTPDFCRVVVGADNWVGLHAYEVKGARAWDGALDKLKFAAARFPWIRFSLVTRSTRTGPWNFQPVKP